MKTIEYRIYRKLREKLRNFIEKKFLKASAVLSSFEDEVKNLCTHVKPPLPLEHYKKVAENSFLFILDHPSEAYRVHEKYLTFISLVLYSMRGGLKLNPTMFSGPEAQQAMKEPWSESISAASTHPRLPSLSSKLSDASSDKFLVVFVPLSVPGTGKSFFNYHLKQKLLAQHPDAEFTVISTDQIRKELMENLKLRKPFLKENQLFDQTGKDARDMFSNRLSNALKAASRAKGKVNFIFLDKNHPPNAIAGKKI